MNADELDVADTLALLAAGEEEAADRLMPLVYDQLRGLENLGIGRVVGIHYRRQLSSPRRLLEANLVYVAPERLYIDGFLERHQLLGNMALVMVHRDHGVIPPPIRLEI